MRTMRIAAVMAALLGSVAGAPADEPEPEPKPEPCGGVLNNVTLTLRISGVGDEGCTVEIKPAHPGTRFEKVTREVDDAATLKPIPVAARSISADKMCAFAIVISDPDGAEQTFKRIVRLKARPEGEPVPSIEKTIYLRATAVARKDRPGKRPG